MTQKKIGIIGAGFSGATIARELATNGYEVDIFEQRSHVAGNCHTQRDPETGVMLHVYGPHIFHTSNEEVWRYVQKFDEFIPFVNRVKAISCGQVYSLPINLLTINQFFRKTLSPAQASDFIKSLSQTTTEEPTTFEQQALKMIGEELFKAFFEGYTLKQWGTAASNLPASILKRLPVRFNYDDNYYNSKFQGIPRNGYTHIVEKMLDHPNIHVHLNTAFEPGMKAEYQHIFYSGPIDAWFLARYGDLAYRTLDFVTERHHGDYQGNPVINYCDAEVPWTRITEHKHFAPWEEHADTIIYKEHSRACGKNDIPYYPIRLSDDKEQLKQYVQLARHEENITFIGRLGTYRYLDMHITIEEALKTSRLFIDTRSSGATMPAFVVDPLN